jgi:hypothetical protein
MDMCICTMHLLIYMCILSMVGYQSRLYTESIAENKAMYIEQVMQQYIGIQHSDRSIVK